MPLCFQFFAEENKAPPTQCYNTYTCLYRYIYIHIYTYIAYVCILGEGVFIQYKYSNLEFFCHPVVSNHQGLVLTSFLQPGTRWLKQKVSGREEIREVDLENGREHPGRKSWILKFIGVDTADQVILFLFLCMNYHVFI